MNRSNGNTLTELTDLDVLDALGKLYAARANHAGNLVAPGLTQAPRQFFSLAVRDLGIVTRPEDAGVNTCIWNRAFVPSLSLASDVHVRMTELYRETMLRQCEKRKLLRKVKREVKKAQKVNRMIQESGKIAQKTADLEQIRAESTQNTLGMMLEQFGEEAVDRWYEMTEFYLKNEFLNLKKRKK